MGKVRLDMLRQNRWHAWLAGALTVISVVALVAYAVLQQGYPTRKYDLNDSGVWVTNDGDGLFGRINKSASALDAYFSPPPQSSFSLDMLQEQATVLAWDKASGRLESVDVAAAKGLDKQAVPVGSADPLDLRAGTVARIDPTTGKIFATRYAVDVQPNLAELDSAGTALGQLAATPKDGSAGEFAWQAVVVGYDGSVHAVDRAGKRATIPFREGKFQKAEYSQVGPLQSAQLTAVGEHIVLFDAVAGQVVVDDGAPIAAGDGDPLARLQQPSATGDRVTIAASRSLKTLRLGGEKADFGPAAEVAAGGAPAAPVQVGGCLYAAWASGSGGGGAKVVRGCGDEKVADYGSAATQRLSRPVWRVNRTSVVLNDTADGMVYDVDLKRRIDNWKQSQAPQSPDQEGESDAQASNKDKPEANPDRLGARPQRTTVLHVLDNDTDRTGRVLTIAKVTQPGTGSARVAIAPDRQSLLYTLDKDGGNSQFTYILSNGTQTAEGQVSVEARRPDENEVPKRWNPPKKADYVVASGGTVGMDLLSVWRDFDGDPVVLASASADAKDGTATTRTDGKLEFTAAGGDDHKGGWAPLSYQVTDGRGDPVKAEARVNVLASKETTGVGVKTQPDAAAGWVGRPIVLTPLANDLPGADPLNPKSSMKLAGPVQPRGGVQVSTDVAAGEVTVTAKAPGSYFLTYSAGYGSAPVTEGVLRVDVSAAVKDANQPVAVPDNAVVRGAAPALIDVLANDSDPLGSVLTVQSATPRDADTDPQVAVAVVRGRWLQVTPLTAEFAQRTETVTYTVTNGVSEPVTGTVTITQIPPLEQDEILTRPDTAVVRDGDSVLVDVLANDAAASGAQLTLLADRSEETEGAIVGQLDVTNLGAADAKAGDLGKAYVAGSMVRYVAPAKVDVATTFTIEYWAQTADGDRKAGRLNVTVNPQPDAKNADQSPAPRPVEARSLSGEKQTIPIPSSGNDPDGDTTTVTGIASAPQFGRVVGLSPTGITYEAYPDAQGTDSFAYTVTDRYGKTGRSVVRVSVVPPGPPQPAVGAPVAVTAEPGAPVTVYPLTSAYFAKNDPVSVVDLGQTNPDLPEGARLEESTQAVRASAPPKGAKPTELSYALTGNAGEGPLSKITITSQEGFRNPPRITDQTASPTGATATVDLLARAYDPDGDSEKLSVTAVAGLTAPGSGGKVSVPVLDRPQAIPFEVTDASGATSAAVIYVPAAGVGGPFVPKGTLLELKEGEKRTIDLADVIKDPAGKRVVLTDRDKVLASPTNGLTVRAVGVDQIEIIAGEGYVGPAAVSLEVTNGTDTADPNGIKAFVTIPVQIGPLTPVLRCPKDVITLVAGGRGRKVDITTLCAVWAPTDQILAGLTYRATWKAQADGVKVDDGARKLGLSAAGDARPGSTGQLEITAEGSKATPSLLNVRVLAAPKPRLAPVTLQEMKAGETRTVDLRKYFTSPLVDAQPTLISIKQTGGEPAQAAPSGGTSVSITPNEKSSGRMTFAVVMSDVTNRARTDRQANGTITFSVFAPPDRVTGVAPDTALRSRTALLRWATPDANGAPIQYYVVKWAGGQQRCPGSPCTITGLKNGKPGYTFQVMAHNKAGDGEWSAPSANVVPNAIPLAPPNFRQTAAGDRTITLAWGNAQGDGSAITHYWIQVGGGGRIDAGTALTKTVPVPDNHVQYTVTIWAENDTKKGPTTTASGQSAGNPILTGSLNAQIGSPVADVPSVGLDWPAADANGPGQPTYTLTRNGQVIYTGAATSFTDTGVAYSSTYTYAVKASTTDPFGVTRTSGALTKSYLVKGQPSPVSISASAGDSKMTVNITWGAAHGTGLTLRITNGGATMWSQAGNTGGGSQAITLAGNPEQTYTLTLTATNDQGESAQSTAQAVTVYTKPVVSGGSATTGQDSSIDFSWALNNRGSAITRVTIGGAGGGATLGGGATGYTISGLPRGASRTITVTATNAAGNSNTISITGKTKDPDPPQPPARSIQISKGGNAQGQPGCGTSGCRYINVNLVNFANAQSCDFAHNGSVWLANRTLQPGMNNTSAYFGYTGDTLSVTCNGVTGSIVW